MLKEEIKNINSSGSELRKFGFTIGGVLIILSLWFLLKNSFTYYFFLTGTGFILSAWLAPIILKPLHKIWMLFAVILGWFMTRFILSVLFFLILTPTAIFARLMQKQFLQLKQDKASPTYWNFREHREIKNNDLSEQF